MTIYEYIYNSLQKLIIAFCLKFLFNKLRKKGVTHRTHNMPSGYANYMTPSHSLAAIHFVIRLFTKNTE